MGVLPDLVGARRVAPGNRLDGSRDPDKTAAMAWNGTVEPPLTDDAARLLATVPEWFGLPESTQEYVDQTRTLHNWAVRDETGTVIGLVLTTWHFEHVWELELMVVDRAHHGQGVGTALVEAIEADARSRGATLLEVRPSAPPTPIRTTRARATSTSGWDSWPWRRPTCGASRTPVCSW